MSSNENKEIIKLDIGGYIYKTTKTTLTKYKNTYFSGLFSGKYKIIEQEDGSIFIDRDGSHFKTLLNFMRSGRIVMPSDPIKLKEILIEAEFYCLKDYIIEAWVCFF